METLIIHATQVEREVRGLCRDIPFVYIITVLEKELEIAINLAVLTLTKNRISQKKTK